jgi:hypothetical protein
MHSRGMARFALPEAFDRGLGSPATVPQAELRLMFKTASESVLPVVAFRTP